MLEGHVANLVTYDAEGLLVGHHIQKAGIDAHVAIGASKRVHLVVLVNLESKRSAVHLCEALGNLVEPRHIGAAGNDLALGVQLGDRLGDIALDVVVRDRKSLQDLGAALHQAGLVEGCAGAERKCCGDD